MRDGSKHKRDTKGGVTGNSRKERQQTPSPPIVVKSMRTENSNVLGWKGEMNEHRSINIEYVGVRLFETDRVTIHILKHRVSYEVCGRSRVCDSDLSQSFTNGYRFIENRFFSANEHVVVVIVVKVVDGTRNPSEMRK
jgi:hypothetical protein